MGVRQGGEGKRNESRLGGGKKKDELNNVSDPNEGEKISQFVGWIFRKVGKERKTGFNTKPNAF